MYTVKIQMYNRQTFATEDNNNNNNNNFISVSNVFSTIVLIRDTVNK